MICTINLIDSNSTFSKTWRRFLPQSAQSPSDSLILIMRCGSRSIRMVQTSTDAGYCPDFLPRTEILFDCNPDQFIA
jgi:hypothetical protein